MNKFLRLFFVAFLGLVGSTSFADDQVDELVWDAMGLDGTSNNYVDFSGIKFTSPAVYAGNAGTGTGQYIQLRSKNNNSGIVTTTSGGKLKSVTVAYNEATTGNRTLDIYGSNTPYQSAADLYGDAAGEKVGSIALGAAEMTLNVEGDYAYVGLRSNNGAIYIDKITVVWEEEGGGETKTATAIEFGEYLTRFTPGKDGDETNLPNVIVTAGDAIVEGAEVKWSLKMGNNWIMGEEEPSIGDGKVYIPNHSCGDLTLTASYAGDDKYEGSNKSYTLKVYKGFMNIQSILEEFPVVGGDTWAAKEAEWNKGYQASYWQVDMPEGGEPKSKEALVTYANGSYTYIKDDYGTLLLYGSGLGFKKGDKISGDFGNDQGFGGIYGTLKSYNGLLELAVNKDDVEFVVKSSDNPVEPKTITLAELNQTNMNEFVRIEDAEFVEANNKNLTFKVGDETFAVFNQWNIDVTALESGAEYILEGMGSVYYKNEAVTNQLYLISFDKKNAGVKTATSVEFSHDFMTRFTPGKDGDETNLPNVLVTAEDAIVEGAEVKWNLEMGNNWIMGEEEPSIGDGKVYIPNHSCGDLTLTASYVGDDKYEGSTNSYTLKVYKGYMRIQSILEEFPVVGGDSWAGKEAEWNKGYQASYWQVDDQFSPKTAIVTYANGSYTYIKDEYGSLLLYGSGLGFKKGDEVALDMAPSIPPHYSGVYGTLKSYNGLLELAVNKDDVELYVKSSDNPVEPKTITLDELNQTNMNEFVRIEDAEFVEANGKNLTFKVGDETLAVYNQFGIKVADDEGKSLFEPGTKYDLEGMGDVYWKNQTLTNQLYLISFEKVDETNIKNVQSSMLNVQSEKSYNISGQPVTRTYRGVVIQNARKVLR